MNKSYHPWIEQCEECDRSFDLLDEEDAQEYHLGHDCEETT